VVWLLYLIPLLSSPPPLGPSLRSTSFCPVPLFTSPPAPSASVYLGTVNLHHRHPIPFLFFFFFLLIFFPSTFFVVFSTSHSLRLTTDYNGVDTHHRVSFSSFPPTKPHSTSGYPPPLSRYINVNLHQGNPTRATIPSLSSPINKTWLFQLLSPLPLSICVPSLFRLALSEAHHGILRNPPPIQDLEFRVRLG
jgi:hypothetical protein